MSHPEGLEIVYNMAELESALNAKVLAISQRRPLMRNLAAVMHQAVMDNFDTGGRPAWVPLAPATVRYKKEAGRERPLIMNNHLRGGITTYHDNDSALVGSNLPYARIHQEGGIITQPPRTQSTYHKRRKDGSVKNRFVKKSQADFEQVHQVDARRITIPARPYLQLTQADKKKICQVVMQYLSRPHK